MVVAVTKDDLMKRFLTLALVVGSFSVCGFVGCGEEEKSKTVSTSSGPDGSTKVTEEKKVETTGSDKPSEKAPEAPK